MNVYIYSVKPDDGCGELVYAITAKNITRAKELLKESLESHCVLNDHRAPVWVTMYRTDRKRELVDVLGGYIEYWRENAPEVKSCHGLNN